jgi:hypothetical protein
MSPTFGRTTRRSPATRDRAKHTLAATVLGAGLALTFPAGAYALSFGYLSASEGGVKLAESSGGNVYNESGGITEKITFRDLKADGDGAYGEADHWAYQYGCNPGTNICYWAWRAIYVDQTDRYGTAYGWRTSYLHEEGHGAADWKTKPKVCVDQAWEPDACGAGTYLNP